MKPEFWQQRWINNELGWHRSEYHPALMKHWQALPKRARVLVPLCGKTHDLIWLAEQGLQVFGIELSELAAEQFFSEHGLNYHSDYKGDYQHFSCVELSIHIIVGDFFKLSETDFPFDIANYKFDGIYDRAALVALPEAMRANYVQKCHSLLKDEYQGVLITFEYDQAAMVGPPHSVNSEEVERHYAKRFIQVETFDFLKASTPFSEMGHEFFNEVTWVIE